MLFSSIPFLYYFLPGVLILYFLAPNRLKNTVLLFSSLIFYGWGEPKYLMLMIASIVIGYISGLLIEAFSETKTSKIILWLNVAINLGFLGYFKYADFFLANFRALTGISVPLLKIALPIGISFYTFQILSYTVDVYRKDVPAQRNIINLAAYVTMFPQLIAGPIVRYAQIAEELEKREHSFENFANGMRRFVFGLSKKILISNALGELCEIFKLSQEKSVLFYWLYSVSFTLQIYFDFSGYSDMAIGLGKMFGFHFWENFQYPFISKSATEFWRRWHISLGTWFRDYVYVPLGGNRVSKPRWLINLLIVWFLTGFWHGAAWNFIIWGLYFAIFLIIEKLFLLKKLEKSRVLSHVYLLIIVIISFVIFNAADMKEAVEYLCGMFGMGGVPLISTEYVYYLRRFGVTILAGVIGATPAPKRVVEQIQKYPAGEKLVDLSEPIVLVLLLVTATSYLIDGSFNPFLYFRF